MKPVSITAVITTFQSEESIGAALRSVFQQTCQPLEIIVVDDGSTDATCSIVEQFSEERLGILLIRLPHSGVVAKSRNAGVAKANGQWVGFLDADDRWEPLHLERFVRTLNGEPAWALFCGNAHRVESGCVRPFFNPLDVPTGRVDFNTFLVRRPVVTSTAVADRALLQEVGGFPQDKSMVAAEDFACWFRLLRARGIWFDSERHATYSVEVEGLTRRGDGEASRRAAIRVLEDIALQESAGRDGVQVKRAISTDYLQLARALIKGRRWRAALSSLVTVLARHPAQATRVIGAALTKRAIALGRTALAVTVITSLATSSIAVVRQKGVAVMLGEAGLADLSLLLSLSMPLAAFSLLPLLGYARYAAELGDRAQAAYRRAARTTLLCFLSGALVMALAGSRLSLPLGSDLGLVAALVMAFGLTGLHCVASLLLFSNRLKEWMRLLVGASVAQLLLTILGAAMYDRTGAVLGLAIPTALVGGGVLARVVRIPPANDGSNLPRIGRTAATNGVVTVTTSVGEASLRQLSASISLTAAAHLQAVLSITGALSAGLNQYVLAKVFPAERRHGGADGSAAAIHCFLRLAAVTLLSFLGISVIGSALLSVLFSRGFADAAPLLRWILLGELMVATASSFTALMVARSRLLPWVIVAVGAVIVRVVSAYTLGMDFEARLSAAYVAAGVFTLAAAGLWFLIRGRGAKAGLGRSSQTVSVPRRL